MNRAVEITFQCDQCGRWYTMAEKHAGKTVKCKDCGAPIIVPAGKSEPADDVDAYGLSERERTALAFSSQREPEFSGESSHTPKPGRATVSKAKASSSSAKSFFSGGIGTVVLLVLIAVRGYLRWERDQARRARANHQPAAVAPFPASAALPPPNVAPWKMPVPPAPPAATEIAPGVMFSEIVLRPDPQSGKPMPGHTGKLWLYLPPGDHKPRSLPCILIVGAGSNLITGMDLGDGDRPEHVVYPPFGFAVLAYELDGRVADQAREDMQAVAKSSQAFLAAQAGLINARVVIEYATTKVPCVDPKRLYAVGHSSAATHALVLAENEPRIAACVAFAPTIDLAVQYPPEAQRGLALIIPGASQFFTRFNPRPNETKINCPLFLFYADDDKRFASQVRDCGTRLTQAGKNVTVSSVRTGGHYDSMIKVGVPRAVKWLKSLPQPGR
jgi:dienelactone hydrolase